LISCESAAQTVNLYYSAIKFLEFKGILWVGESLPLRVHSLGELAQLQVSLRERDGAKIKGAVWQMGQLHGPFERGKLYDLSMRLEYMLPVSVNEFASDFESIHPKRYTVCLDFSVNTLYGNEHKALIGLGPQTFDYDMPSNLEQDMATGHKLKLIHERDYCSIMVSGAKEAPFSHNCFPSLSVQSRIAARTR